MLAEGYALSCELLNFLAKLDVTRHRIIIKSRQISSHLARENPPRSRWYFIWNVGHNLCPGKRDRSVPPRPETQQCFPSTYFRCGPRGSKDSGFAVPRNYIPRIDTIHLRRHNAPLSIFDVVIVAGVSACPIKQFSPFARALSRASDNHCPSSAILAWYEDLNLQLSR